MEIVIHRNWNALVVDHTYYGIIYITDGVYSYPRGYHIKRYYRYATKEELTRYRNPHSNKADLYEQLDREINGALETKLGRLLWKL